MPLQKTVITTYSGIHFDLARPHFHMVEIADISHHLSQVCRWAGATQSFWSVAQHSVILSYIVPKELQQWALMHDAAEAYIGDITRPFKNMLHGVRAVEEAIMEAICKKFELPYPEPSELMDYDDQIQRWEALTLLGQHDGNFIDRAGMLCEMAALTPYQQMAIPAYALEPKGPQEAEILFALRFHELFKSFEAAL